MFFYKTYYKGENGMSFVEELSINDMQEFYNDVDNDVEVLNLTIQDDENKSDILIVDLGKDVEGVGDEEDSYITFQHTYTDVQSIDVPDYQKQWNEFMVQKFGEDIKPLIRQFNGFKYGKLTDKQKHEEIKKIVKNGTQTQLQF